MGESPKLLKPEEVAATLQLKKRTILRYLQLRIIKPTILESGAYRVHPDDLAEYIGKLREAGNHPPRADEENNQEVK